jgi:class 3 adenylate cyclase
MPEDRRHAAIIFTDIVGYTKLMGRDEDAAFDMLARNHTLHEALIEKHHGILIKEIGDGTLASFPLASNAVRCAMDIQKEAKNQDIPLKIGIHEGEMVFARGDVLGDGVNIASRLQEDAQEGCINISASVYRDIKNKADIQTKHIGEKTFKNVDEPIKVYRVVCGDEEKEDKPRKDRKVKKPRSKLPYYILSGAIVVIVAIILIWKLIPIKKSVELEKSIAVKPFFNDSGD